MYGTPGATLAEGTFPRPQVNRDYAPFYDGIQQGKLLIQKCNKCSELQHPPGPMCGHCNAIDWSMHECSGNGTLHSFTIHHYPPLAGFDTPHAIALADMEEGFRLVAGFKNVEHDAIAIGMEVRLDYPEVEPGYRLYTFVPA